jgi:hypothetical protein
MSMAALLSATQACGAAIRGSIVVICVPDMRNVSHAPCLAMMYIMGVTFTGGWGKNARRALPSTHNSKTSYHINEQRHGLAPCACSLKATSHGRPTKDVVRIFDNKDSLGSSTQLVTFECILVP